jgi:hypothetical protein
MGIVEAMFHNTGPYPFSSLNHVHQCRVPYPHDVAILCICGACRGFILADRAESTTSQKSAIPLPTSPVVQ